jgi:hypothetical protein
MSFSLTVGASIEESNNDERKRAPSEEKKLKLEKSLSSSMNALQEVPPFNESPNSQVSTLFSSDKNLGCLVNGFLNIKTPYTSFFSPTS